MSAEEKSGSDNNVAVLEIPLEKIQTVLYEMKVGEEVSVTENSSYERVPGGWVLHSFQADRLLTSVFIPITNKW